MVTYTYKVFFSCSASTHDKCKTSGSNNLITIKEKINK
jgi:hypothetical protein